MKLSSARTRTPIVPSNVPLKAVHLSAPDGIVLAGNVPDSVIAKAQQKLSTHHTNGEFKPFLIHMENGSNTVVSTANQQTVPVEVVKPTRPASVSKFRSMIMHARSGSGD